MIELLYRGALRFYPTRHRRMFGDEMVETFAEGFAENARIDRRIRFVLREAAAVFVSAAGEHLRTVSVDYPEAPPRFPSRLLRVLLLSLCGVIVAAAVSAFAALHTAGANEFLLRRSMHDLAPGSLALLLTVWAAGIMIAAIALVGRSLNRTRVH